MIQVPEHLRIPMTPAIKELINLATLYTGDDYVELYSRDAQLVLREELAKVLKRIKEEEEEQRAELKLKEEAPPMYTDMLKPRQSPSIEIANNYFKRVEEIQARRIEELRNIKVLSSEQSDELKELLDQPTVQKISRKRIARLKEHKRDPHPYSGLKELLGTSTEHELEGASIDGIVIDEYAKLKEHNLKAQRIANVISSEDLNNYNAMRKEGLLP